MSAVSCERESEGGREGGTEREGGGRERERERQRERERETEREREREKESESRMESVAAAPTNLLWLQLSGFCLSLSNENFVVFLKVG